MQLKVLEWMGLYRPDDYLHKRFDQLAKKCESPIEKAFWSVGYFQLSNLGILTPQATICGYRADFTLVGSGIKMVIELDGHDYHKTKKQRQSDYQRERSFQSNGWQVIRFTGSEIYLDTQRCVDEITAIARRVL